MGSSLELGVQGLAGGMEILLRGLSINAPVPFTPLLLRVEDVGTDDEEQVVATKLVDGEGKSSSMALERKKRQRPAGGGAEEGSSSSKPSKPAAVPQQGLSLNVHTPIHKKRQVFRHQKRC